MSIIEEHWRQEESRWDDGIFFGNDEFISLIGKPEDGFKFGERSSILPLLFIDPDGWVELDAKIGCSVETGEILIYGGDTSCEGSGFIAVEDKSTRKLLWLLHSTDSEPFVKITTDGANLLALSDEYPRQFEWIIPIAAPELLIVKPKRQ